MNTLGGLDSLISLWDIGSPSKVRDFKGHATGVFGMTFHPYYRILVSAGSDRDAVVITLLIIRVQALKAWNPWSRQATPIGRLRGHNAPLVAVEVADSAPEVFTADINGTFRIWDLRTFHLLLVLFSYFQI